MTVNSYTPPQPPPVWNDTASSIIADAKAILQKTKVVQDNIVNSVTIDNASFENVILPLALDEAESTSRLSALTFYSQVSADQKLREASAEADRILSEGGIELTMRQDIFERVKAVKDKNETLDNESMRLLNKYYKSYVKLGLNLPEGERRDRFKEILKRMADIEVTYAMNLSSETGGIWATREELDGLDKDKLNSLEKGQGEYKDKLKLTFKYPDVIPGFNNIKDAEIRKKLYIGFQQRCPSNAALFREVIILRDEAARMLGYPNHAELRIEDKMMKTATAVRKLLEDLRIKLMPMAQEELKVLETLKRQDLIQREVQSDQHYYLWDHSFYNNMMLKRNYAMDKELISQWFPLEHCLKVMLDMFSDLFGMKFVELNESDMKTLSSTGNAADVLWHEDVRMYSVWNDGTEGNGFLGYFYLDLHPRDGKYGHAANFQVSPNYADKSGKRVFGATALVCNFPKPVGGRPSLLPHEEVRTLFHELGHAIHDLLGQTKYAAFAGHNCVVDFVECPSQMLENFVFQSDQLKALSRHYSHTSPEAYEAWKQNNKALESPVMKEPSETLPDDLIASIINSRYVNGAIAYLRQLHYGLYDLDVHTPKTHEDAEKMDYPAYYNKLKRDLSMMDGNGATEDDFKWMDGTGALGHFVGGYDAGYYGYISSEAYSADIFETFFAKDPMNSKEGRRYRRQVLSFGGSKDEMEVLEAYLGRTPSNEAFYKQFERK